MSMTLERKVKKEADLDKKGLPNRDGVYLAIGVWGGDEPEEIEVYHHPVKGLCCFQEDFGSAGTGVDDRYDCHVSVQCTGLTFVKRVGDLDTRGKDDI